jgi:hypothetical protein
MKLINSIAIAVFMAITMSATAQNINYIGNREPLSPTPFIPLPIKSVSAEGWLLTQLQNQKSGLTGNAEALYDELKSNAAWLGGNAPYSDWERPTYYLKGLIALAYVLNDTELINKTTKWIDWAINSQKANGFFGPPGNKDWWSRMPLLYAMKDHYEATGDARVIPFFKKYFEYENNNLESNPLNAWARSRAGDNIEIVFWLYNRTGESFLLNLADKLKGQAYDWTDIYTNNKFLYFGNDYQPKHNVNVPQAMKMPAIMYQKTNLAADRDAFQKGYEHLMHDHGQPYGMPSGNEKLNGISSLTGVETCSVVEQMQSCDTAQMILGDPAIGDMLEIVTFNALPGAFTKDFKGHSYYIQANQVTNVDKGHGFEQDYGNALMQGPYSGYPCCRFNLHMGWPYFVKNMWAATNDGGLAVMAYGPSKVTALVGDGVDVTIDEVTNYPFEDNIKLNISLTNETTFPLKLRIPAWCENPEIKVNGVTQAGVSGGMFYSINRSWKNNDAVEISFPMILEVQDRVNHAVSVHRGPLVYSLKVGEEWIPKNNYPNGFYEFETKPTTNWNYALVLDKNNPDATITFNELITMPANPFVQSTTPISLTAKAKRIPGWTLTRNGSQAYDPPYGPVVTQEETETVTLIPFGAQTLRVTTLPYVGNPTYNNEEFTDNFDRGNWDGWVIYNGGYYVENGQFVITNSESGADFKAVQTSTKFSDFSYQTEIQLNSASDNAGILFRVTKPSMGENTYNGYYAGISAEGFVVLGKSNGAWSEVKKVNTSVSSSKWYNLKVVAIDSNIKVYLGDMETPIIDVNDYSFYEGSIGVRSWKTPVRYDNISVKSLVSTTDECDQKVIPTSVSASHESFLHEGPEAAVDNNVETKWCVSVNPNPWLELTFKEPVKICKWFVLNSGNESTNFITSGFRLQRYDNGSWIDVDVVTNNVLNKVTRVVSPFTATKVRLSIDKGEKNGTTTRIREFAVYGKEDLSSSIKHSEARKSFAIEGNFPNPFSEETTIKCTVPDNIHQLKLQIYNLTGALVDMQSYPVIPSSGVCRIKWNSNNLESGVYLYSVSTIDNDNKLLADYNKFSIQK